MKRIFAKLGKIDILAQFFRPKALSTQVIGFDKLLYTELNNVDLSDENLDEALFDKACAELGIKESFDYAMSFILQDDKSLVFLTLYENLEQKCDFAFAEPLLWRNLRAYQTQIPPFYTVFVLSQNYGYVAFFGDEKLLCLKNIPQFTLKYLRDKDKSQRLDFLNERVCEQSRIKELCALYQSKAFVFVNDELNLRTHLSEKLEIPHIKAQIQPQRKDFRVDLAFKEAQRRDERANFLRHKIKSDLFKRLVAAFLLCFLLGFILPISEFYIRQNEVKNSFKDNPLSFDELEKENADNTLLIEEYKAKLAFINKELKPIFLLDTLQTLFALLHQNEAKILSLDFKGKEMKIAIPKDKESERFIKELYSNTFFTLKHKELLGEVYELNLGLKDE